MATDFHTPKLPAAPTSFTLSAGMAPAAPLMRLLARFDRPKVEAFAEVSIALLDLIDGDCDLEGQCNEDEISRCTDLGLSVEDGGPGCSISDPDAAVDDGPCDEPTMDLEPDEGV